MLIVEDEMIIAANISLQLTNLGYEVNAILPRGEDAVEHIKNNPTDVVLLDIQLKGKLDGIQTAQEIQKVQDIPIVYLTANTDDAHFNRARSTHPRAFISKPFKKIDLQRALELAAASVEPSDYPNLGEPSVLTDRIFVRYRDRMVKIMFDDIFYIEADRSYCKLFLESEEILLVMSLKSVADKIPEEDFLRIHRSYLVNLKKVDEVEMNSIRLGRYHVPMSKKMRGSLMDRLQLL